MLLREVTSRLIERGAEINPINEYNQTPLNMAHGTALIAFLKTKGAKTGAQMLTPAQPPVAPAL